MSWESRDALFIDLPKQDGVDDGLGHWGFLRIEIAEFKEPPTISIGSNFPVELNAAEARRSARKLNEFAARLEMEKKDDR